MNAQGRLQNVGERCVRSGGFGPDLFRKAWEFGLEGMVSKRADRPYRAGRSPDWVKVKNRKHPAMYRVAEAEQAKAFARAERER